MQLSGKSCLALGAPGFRAEGGRGKEKVLRIEVGLTILGFTLKLLNLVLYWHAQSLRFYLQCTQRTR